MSISVPRIGSIGKGSKRNKYLMIGIPLGIVLIVAILYFVNPKFKKWFQKTFHIKSGVAIVAVAPNVTFDLQGLNEKSEIRPNSQFSIVGKFTDEQGAPIGVIQGLYYVYRTDANTGNKAIYSQGILGQNISDFDVKVSTTGWPDGKYDIDVADHALENVKVTTPVRSPYNPISAAPQNIVASIG